MLSKRQGRQFYYYPTITEDEYRKTDGFKYLKEYKITIPVIDDGESATVYSLDGNIYNPYPPNSYEGATWINTNFLVVVN